MTDNGYDPMAAFRALAEAPRAGFETAAAVVERLLALGRPGATAVPGITWNGQPPDGEAPVDRRVQLRRARADAERVLDAYGDWARQMLDAVFGLADAGDGAEVLRLGPVGAGDAASAELWLHAPPGRLTAPARLHATALTAHDGGSIPAAAVTFDPAVLAPASGNGNGAASPATRVRLEVPAGTAPGTYHAHVLAEGLPEVALAIQAEVRG